MASGGVPFSLPFSGPLRQSGRYDISTYLLLCLLTVMWGECFWSTAAVNCCVPHYIGHAARDTRYAEE